MKTTEQWTKDQLRALVKSCKENAREDRRQAKECAGWDPKRANFLEGGVRAMDHAAKEIQRILNRKTSVEALVDVLKQAGEQP